MTPATGIWTIDLGAVTANYRRLRERVGGKPVAAAVKADAYGLGMTQIAPVLAKAGCDFFYVAYPEEAMQLRAILGPAGMIAVLHGVAAQNYGAIAGRNIIPVINHLDDLRAWHRAAQERAAAIPVIVQLDTGMNRLGLGADEVARLLAHPEWLDGLQVKYWLSHLACADEPAHPMNARQLGVFSQYLIKLPPAPLSLANSSGIFLGPSYHFDQVRAGAALYGINPTPEQPNPMQPVAQLAAPIIQIRTLTPRSQVGYGASWRSDRLGKAAILPVGYADGFARSLGNRGVAHIQGHVAPIIGRISMDLLAVDVTDVPEQVYRLGAMAALIGADQSVDAVAKLAGTIGYEILTQLGRRYQRVYQGNNDVRDKSSGAAGTCVS